MELPGHAAIQGVAEVHGDLAQRFGGAPLGMGARENLDQQGAAGYRQQ